jgi:hypothetical protein
LNSGSHACTFLFLPILQIWKLKFPTIILSYFI